MAYLAIDSTRYKGRRYVRGDEIPAELASRLDEIAPKGQRWHVENEADLTDENGERVPLVLGAQPLSQEKTTLNNPDANTIQVSDSQGVHHEGTSEVRETDKPATEAKPAARKRS